jgi:glycosyltransferase involved in cell wall biosynthesis
MDRMRIAWCTPFSRQSATGRFSRVVVEQLRRLAEVDVWHPRTAEPLDTSAARFIPLTGGPADAARLKTYDLAVYNMGNQAGEYREIFEVSRDVPGIVVLHDLDLRDFFNAYHARRPDATPEAAAAREGPCFEEALAGAYAVVTHSRFSAERAGSVFPGLARYLPPPYEPAGTRAIPPLQSLGAPAGRMLAVTLDHAGPDPRIRPMLEALGSRPALAARIFYVVIGASPSAQQELVPIVQEHGLAQTVHFAGPASEESLAAYLTHADWCVTLGSTVQQAAVSSLIGQLFYGKPLIVSQAGVSAELPGDCAIQVRADQEVEDLATALERLCDDPPLRRRMGERARAFARETFRADRYARGILDVGAELLDAKPLFDFTDRVGRELARMGVSADLPVVSRVAAMSNALFGKPGQ